MTGPSRALKFNNGERTMSETVNECCPNCAKENEIPDDIISKCEFCGASMLPCHGCISWEEMEGCDWDENKGCWKFPK